MHSLTIILSLYITHVKRWGGGGIRDLKNEDFYIQNKFIFNKSNTKGQMSSVVL